MFTRQNCLTEHFSERTPIIKRRVTCIIKNSTLCKQDTLVNFIYASLRVNVEMEKSKNSRLKKQFPISLYTLVPIECHLSI